MYHKILSFFWTIHHSLILRKSNESFDNQLCLSLITEDNSLLEISNVNSLTKGPSLTAVKAGTASRLKATYERKSVFRVSVCGVFNGWFGFSYS